MRDGRASFLKKEAKNFLSWGPGGETGTGQTERSFFAFLFTKKQNPAVPGFAVGGCDGCLRR